MSKISIAIQLYSLRDYMAQDFEGTILKLKEMGYDGVEFAGTFNKSAIEIKKICENATIIPVSAHVPYAELVEDMGGIFQFYKEVGCKYIAIPYLTEELRPGGECEEAFYQNVNKMSEEIKQYGMTLLYHNHDFEFQKIGDQYVLDYIYEHIPLLETELDTCWVNIGGENPAEYLLKYKDRSPVVHLKDFVGGWAENMYELIGLDENQHTDAETQEFEFRPIGQGIQNVQAIIDAAQKAGSRWIVVEQDTASAGKTSMECTKESIEYLKRM